MASDELASQIATAAQSLAGRRLLRQQVESMRMHLETLDRLDDEAARMAQEHTARRARLREAILADIQIREAALAAAGEVSA